MEYKMTESWYFSGFETKEDAVEALEEELAERAFHSEWKVTSGVGKNLFGVWYAEYAAVKENQTDV